MDIESVKNENVCLRQEMNEACMLIEEFLSSGRKGRACEKRAVAFLKRHGGTVKVDIER